MNNLILTPEILAFNFVMISLIFFATALYKLKGVDTPGPETRQWGLMILAGIMFFMIWLIT